MPIMGTDLAAAAAARATRYLIVEDDEADAVMLERILRKQYGLHAEVDQVETGAEAVDLAARRQYGVVLIDYRLPDMNGLELIARLGKSQPKAALILLTGQRDDSVAAEALRSGAHDYLPKRHMQAQRVEQTVTRARTLAEGLSQTGIKYRAEGPHRENLPASDQPDAAPRGDIEHFVRSLSHDMTASFMLLEHSFHSLKQTCQAHPQAALTAGVTHVEACLQQSKRFLDDLVMLSKTGSVGTKPTRCELTAVVDALLYELGAALNERQVQVAVDRPLPAVWCHETRVSQVLGNLLRNALAYGCDPVDGRIEIRWLRSAGTPGDAGRIWLRISDNGPGIPAKYHQEVFRPSWRAPGTTAEGSGMGLAIVRQVVEFYGGQIEIEPQLCGTAFRLSLPAAEPA